MNMDKHHIKSVLDGLKSNSSSRIQETLIKIKSKIITDASGIKLFRDCGGLEYLVPHLRKPNERILDMSLSILGNVCLEEESSLAVGKLNIFGSLVTILKTVNRDSIIGRTCRLIGNLAQRQVNAVALHAHGAVAALTSVIDNRDKNTSYPTLTMAVRAIRQLWMVTEKRDEMLGLNAVHSVSILLAVECESAGIIKSSNKDKIADRPNKSQEELITGILKCFGYFTTYANTQCAQQIQGDGRGYQCLVVLTHTYESLALKCLMNLCYLSTCRPFLGSAGFVEVLVGILKKYSESALWPEGAVKALGHISQNAVNRARLRHAGGLGLLVAAARDHSHAMPALLQYFYDRESLQVLINEGLVALLTDKLTSYLITMENKHKSQEMVPAASSQSNKKSLLKRRRQQCSPEKRGDLKVVIESDNMMVGFLDNVNSDVTDSDSENDSSKVQWFQRSRKRSKLDRSLACLVKERINLKLMYPEDWSYYSKEGKSLEWPATSKLPCISSPKLDQCPKSPFSDSNNSAFSPEHRGSSSKRSRWDWSPESGFSTGEGSSMSPLGADYPWSPSSSSSPNSPLSEINHSSDSEISGRYSPVCSEPDAGEAGASGEAGAVGEAGATSSVVLDVTHDLDELIVDDEEDCPLKEDDVSAELETAKSSSIDCIIILLYLVSSENSVSELVADKECVSALLDYIERCKRPVGRAARVLARVFSNTLCLMNVLKFRFALRIHEMSVNSKHTKCMQCKQVKRLCEKYLGTITNLAESSYGIGEICHQLLKGSSYMKETLSLTLPYIVSAERPLKKFYVDCRALNLLLEIISEAKEDLQYSVTAITKLANNVHIKDPKSFENRYKENVYIEYDPILDNLAKEDIVTFELDDSEIVKTNKVFLCQNSDVFSAMLLGQFKESVATRVKLKNVTKPALEYLLTLLHCGTNNAENEIKIFPMATALETNLEVLLLADRFLFEKLKERLSSAILQFLLTAENADKIYIWSLNDGMGFLCVESVAYLLTGKMCELDRIKSFQNILGLQYKEQWLDDIKTMILRQLQK